MLYNYHVKKMDIQNIGWEKIIAFHIYNKKYCLEYIKNIEEIIHIFKKWAKDRHLIRTCRNSK